MGDRHATRTNHLRTATVDGHGRLQVGDTIIHNYSGPQRNCHADLLLTDPRDEKIRVEDTKGGLIRESYQWILDHDDFRQWRDDEKSRLLWIKGDAGKGKTMLLCGIIDELSKSRVQPPAFFLCQGTEPNLDNATAVLRGLMYLLILQQPSLIQHVERAYEHTGKQLFEGEYAFYKLSRALTSMLHDPLAKESCLVIDALDECERDRQQLLDFIAKSVSDCPAKWIVSSRYRGDIEQSLQQDVSRKQLNLELNEGHVIQAINTFIDRKVSELVSIKDDRQRQQEIQCELRSKASGTFLWVDLVVRELQNTQPWRMLKSLKQMPSGLRPLYIKMMKQVQNQPSEDDRSLCVRLLSMATVAYQPLALCELRVLSDRPEGMNLDSHIQRVIDMCGSFLTVRGGFVYLIHQSVKDYFTDSPNAVLGCSLEEIHHKMALQSIEVMGHALRRDIYGLKHPGAPVPQRSPDPDSLEPIRYSCLNWVKHLEDGPRDCRDLTDGGVVHKFLKTHYLHWLEALSLIQNLSGGILIISNLIALVQSQQKSSELAILARDMLRFVRYYAVGIKRSPLQVYSSALIFSPTKSIVRELFRKEQPEWIPFKPLVEMEWSACLQTLESHSGGVNSVAFSPNGRQLASASYDGTVKLWNTATGQCLQTLERHSSWVILVAFSADSYQLASASADGTIKFWDTTTSQCLQTLEGHNSSVYSIAFSPNGRQLASASYNGTVKLWNTATGQCLQTLEGHSSWVILVAFSADSCQLASASYDKTVKLWDTATGQCLQTLEAHDGDVKSVTFSADGCMLAATSGYYTIKLWDTATGQHIQTLEGHSILPDFFEVTTEESSREPDTQDIMLSQDGAWINSGSRNILWLPPEYRPEASAVEGSRIAIGCASGHVLLLQFVLDYLHP